MQTNWQQGDVKLSDMTMHYTRTGGDKPTLVLAHGFSDNGMCWLPVAQELSASYDVVLPDARGHGLSSRVEPGQTANRGADLAAFILPWAWNGRWWAGIRWVGPPLPWLEPTIPI